MASPLYLQIYQLVKAVPAGKVASYGQIALLTGNIRRSRIIGYAMAACKDATVPCHRIVHKDGSLPKTFGVGGPNLQKAMLEQEGIIFTVDNKVCIEYFI